MKDLCLIRALSKSSFQSKKTQRDVRLLESFLKTKDDKRKIEDIPAFELYEYIYYTDKASVNEAAMRTVAVMYPKILDVGCFFLHVRPLQTHSCTIYQQLDFSILTFP